MDAILESLPAYMLVGILIVVGVSQVHRVLGAALGVLFWLAVAALGGRAYDKGGALGFPGLEFPRTGFFALCVFFVAVHIYAAYAALGAKKRQKLREQIRSRDGDDDDD